MTYDNNLYNNLKIKSIMYDIYFKILDVYGNASFCLHTKCFSLYGAKKRIKSMRKYNKNTHFVIFHDNKQICESKPYHFATK